MAYDRSGPVRRVARAAELVAAGSLLHVNADATHLVLRNERSGVAKGEAKSDIRDRFQARGVRAEVRSLGPGDDVGRAARRALDEGYEVLVAAGGDGTVNAVAGAVIERGAILGVLPLGTLNHFAKDLGIPLDLDGAIDTVCNGQTRRVDIGQVNGRVFVNNSSLGLYPQVVRERDDATQRLGRGKWPAFVWATWQVMVRYPFLDVRLDVNGETVDYRTPIVFIGNNRYELEGLNLGTREVLDEGILSVNVVRAGTRVDLLLLALRALFGRLRQGGGFESFVTARVEITARRSTVMVATDGEVERLRTPLAYECTPGKLAVLAPIGRGG